MNDISLGLGIVAGFGLLVYLVVELYHLWKDGAV